MKLVFFCILWEIVILVLSPKLIFYLLLLFAGDFYFKVPAAWHYCTKKTFNKAKKLIISVLLSFDSDNSNMNYGLFYTIIGFVLYQVLPAFLFDLLIKLYFAIETLFYLICFLLPLLMLFMFYYFLPK